MPSCEIKQDIQATSIAEEISNTINSKYDVTWVSPFLVQLFIVLTKTGRTIAYNVLQASKTTLQLKKAELVRQSQKGNDLAKKISVLRAATSIITEQVNNILKIVPLDSTLSTIPEVSDFLNLLSSNVPIKVPEYAIFDLAGIGGFELLDGVKDFRSLSDKIDELEFRLSRTLAFSDYIQAGSTYLDNQLNKITIYLDIIETLDINGF